MEPGIDHVLLATLDLEAGHRTLRDRYGIVSVEGGRHPNWGTANRIAPVGDAYLELVAVVDKRVAASNPFGRWVADASAAELKPIGWAARTASLDAVAKRLGLDVHHGSRAAPDGQLLRWSLAGVERAMAEPLLPFFIDWAVGTPHPSQVSGTAANAAVAISRLELTGDVDRLREWLGDESARTTVKAGPPGVAKVVLSTPGGEVTIR